MCKAIFYVLTRMADRILKLRVTPLTRGSHRLEIQGNLEKIVFSSRGNIMEFYNSVKYQGILGLKLINLWRNECSAASCSDLPWQKKGWGGYLDSLIKRICKCLTCLSRPYCKHLEISANFVSAEMWESC